MSMRVNPVSSVYSVNRYIPRKVRDQLEMVQKTVKFSLPCPAGKSAGRSTAKGAVR